MALIGIRHQIQRMYVKSLNDDPHLRLPRNPLLKREEILAIFEEETSDLDNPHGEYVEGLEDLMEPEGDLLESEEDYLD